MAGIANAEVEFFVISKKEKLLATPQDVFQRPARPVSSKTSNH